MRCTHLTVCSLSKQAVTFEINIIYIFDPNIIYRLILWFLSHIFMRLMKKKNKTIKVWKWKLYLHVNIKLLYHMYRATGVHRITINTPDDTEVSWIFFRLWISRNIWTRYRHTWCVKSVHCSAEGGDQNKKFRGNASFLQILFVLFLVRGGISYGFDKAIQLTLEINMILK